MKKSWPSITFLLSSCILIFTIGCSSQLSLPTPLATAGRSQVINPVLVGSDNCALPCWNGIFPGETSVQTTIDILGKMSDSGMGDYVVFPEDIEWTGNGGDYQILHFVEERIVRITIYLDKFPLADIVSFWGNPNAFEINLSPHGPPHELNTYFPEQGMIVFSGGLIESNPDKLTQIPPQVSVRMVMFVMNNNDINLFIDNYLATYAGESNIVAPTLYQWND